jgi:hypothetical protein
MSQDDHSTAEQELVELREAVLDDWLTMTSNVTDALRDIQQTISWRVTRPLRAARTFSLKANDIGVVPASRLAAIEVARRLRRR